jgi:putative transposase
MAQRLIKFEKGGFYHIYNRGCSRERIFRSNENYRFLRSKLFEYSYELDVEIVAYSLMPNHYHLLFRQTEDVSAGYLVQQVFNSYSKAFNKMYRRSGTLFEGPFRAKHVDDESYLIYLCRYIHRNPLEAGLVKNIGDWEFSDYQNWINPQKDDSGASNFFAGYFSSAAEYEKFAVRSEPPPDISEGLKKFAWD